MAIIEIPAVREMDEKARNSIIYEKHYNKLLKCKNEEVESVIEQSVNRIESIKHGIANDYRNTSSGRLADEVLAITLALTDVGYNVAENRRTDYKYK